jgi:amino acid transporter
MTTIAMADHESLFTKVLNQREVFALAFGAMIGWGWVVLTGSWILGAGTFGAILSFMIGGALVLFVGLTYAELTVAMPKCGGEQVFSMRALGPGGSFICTWAIILGYIGVVAFEACAFPTVIQYLAPNFLQGYLYTVAGFKVYASWVGLGVVFSFIITGINYFGIKLAATLNVILTFAIFAIGIILIAGSVVHGNLETAKPFFDHGVSGIFSVAMMTPFMFVGFDVIPQAAEEMNIHPRKIGITLMLSILIAIVFYILVIMAVSLVLTKPELDASPLVTADAMKRVFFNIDAAAKVLIIGGMAGIVTSWNSFFMGGSRAIYAMAEAKMLPRFLARLHPVYKTPVNAVFFIGLVSCIAPFFGRAMMVWIANAGSFTIVVAYVTVALSYLILRKNEPNMERPYKVKGGRLVGGIAVLLGLFMGILYMPGMPSGLELQEWSIILFWIILGIIFGLIAKLKYGAVFGTAEGLLMPIKHRTRNRSSTTQS